MSYQLDELSTENIREEGLDTHVIAKRIPVTVGKGSLIFEIILWCLGIIPGLIFLILKVKAGNYFDQLQQKIQHDASQIDNYLEQRVIVLQNCARLLDKAIDLDKSTYENIAKYRAGIGEDVRNDAAAAIDSAANNIRIAFENCNKNTHNTGTSIKASIVFNPLASTFEIGLFSSRTLSDITFPV